MTRQKVTGRRRVDASARVDAWRRARAAFARAKTRADAFGRASSRAFGRMGDGARCAREDAVAARRAHDRGQAANHGALCLAQVIWGLMHVVSHRALTHVRPTAFCALRLALALPFLGWNARREGGFARARAAALAMWTAPMACAIGGAYLMVFVCNERSGATLVACVQPLLPVLVAVMKFVRRRGRERRGGVLW